MSDSGSGGSGLLGHRAVAFWTVVTGILAVVTFTAAAATQIFSGPPLPTPSPFPPATSPPFSPTPAPSSPDPTESPDPTVSPEPPQSQEPTQSPEPRQSPEPTPARLTSPTTSALRFTFSGLGQYPCAMEGRLHSLFQAPEPLRVENHSSQPIQLYYLDAGGNRYPQVTLPPGESYQVATHLGDVWLAANAQADCAGIFAVRGSGLLRYFDVD